MPTRASEELVGLRIAQHPDVVTPGEEVTVAVQDVVLRRSAGRPVLRIQQVEGEVAAHDPLSSNRLRCFHQNAV